MKQTRRGFIQTAAAVTLSPAWLREARADSNGTLTVALSNNPITCDPINMTSHDTEILSQTVFENLVEFDGDGVLKPQLAKTLPEISADKLTYTFHLRDDVFFQNGQKLTSADVKDSFDYFLDPAHKAVRAPIFSRLSHAETDGDEIVKIVLKEPYAPWTSFLTKFMGIWPKGSRQQFGDEYFRLKPIGVGTGPGIFEEWRPNDFVSFKANPNYWQKGLPHWDRLVIKIVPEDATRVAYLLSGQADIIGAPPPRDFARLKTRPHIQGAARATLGGWTVLLNNCQKPPFDDINFRLAMAHAVDRKTICEKIYYGLVERSAIPAPASSWWFDAEADKSLDYDLDKARAYLAKSKYADGAEFDLLTPAEPYLLSTQDCAIFLQSELAKLKIKMNIKAGEFSVVVPAIIRGEHQCGLVNFMSPGEPTYMITVSFTPNNFLSKATNFPDPKIAALLKTTFVETDEAKLKPVYAEMLKYIAEQSPCTWIGFFDAANLWRDRVKDFKVNQGLTITVRDVAVS